MGAVGLRYRTELRSRWRAWLGLALVIGLVGGAVAALAGGARRTDTAYTRFLDAQRASDVLLFKGTADLGSEGPPGPPLDPDAIAALPGVADTAVAKYFFTTIGSGVGGLVPAGGRLGGDINRFKLLEGRQLDPTNPAEVVVGFAFAEQYGYRVGDTIELFDPTIIDNPPPDTPPEIIAQATEASRHVLALLPGGTATVVGIEASPGEFPPQIEGTGRYLIHASPALAPVLDDMILFLSGGDVVAVRLDPAVIGVDAFLSSPTGAESFVLQRDSTASAVRSVHTQADALWILALLTALAGVLVGSQLVARITFLDSDDQPVLAVLGMVRRQRLLVGLARSATIGVGAAATTMVVAAAASPLFPTGLAENAEPNPGFRLDGMVVALGGLAVVAAVVAVAAWPSWLAARRSFAAGSVEPGPHRPSLVGRLLGAFPGSPSSEIGVRMALEPGRGRSAVPVRSTITAVTLGVAALAASLVFAASLTHLLGTPRLYGKTWDAEITTYDDAIVTDGLPILEADARVTGLAAGRTRNSFNIGGRRVDGLGIDQVAGGLTPSILEGRAPVADDEIVVGTATMHDLGVEVGDTLEVAPFAGDGVTAPMRVVGRAVFPVFGDAGQLGHGVYVTRAGSIRIDPKAAELSPSVLLRLAPGADLDGVVDDLAAELGYGTVVAVIQQGKPTDIVNFGRVKQTPNLLGVLLGVVSGVVLLQLLVTASRRRRRDLAVLKALGFVRRQVRAAVIWQAATLMGVALIVGVPLGIGAGTALWGRFAGGLGVLPEAQIRPLAFGLVVGGGLLVALVIAAVPARSAARTSAGIALRSE